MKIGRHGQVGIPQKYRSRFTLAPGTDVEFVKQNAQLALKKAGSKAHSIRKFSGILKGCGLRSDDLVEAMRGR